MKRFIKSTFLSTLWVLAVSCSFESGFDTPDDPDDGNKATITFNVRAPGMSRGGSTRAFPAGYEEDIDDITVFLAHDDGSGFRMDSMIVVRQFIPVSATTQSFTLDLPTSTIPTKIFIVANLMDADNSLGAGYGNGFTTANGRGFDEAAFIRRLTDRWAEVGTDASGTGAVCMYMAGTAILPTITGNENNLHIPLLRWVARTDVNMDLDADSKSFVPTGITSWHGYRDACVLAEGAAYDTGNAARVLHPTLADAARLDPDVGVSVATTGTSGLIATTYMGEHDGATSNEERLDAPCLILGGYFNGSATESFYRIDFDSGLAEHPFGQILRNWQYVFNVTKITSAGYDTPVEAASNPSHSIVAEVQMWEENVQQINFASTGDYMYVNTLDVQFDYNQGAQNTFVVRSTIPFDWGLGTTAALDDTSDTALADVDFSVSITARDTSDAAYTDYTFTVTTLADNTSNARNEAVVYISARNALMSIELSQRSESITDRVINVLSLTDNIGSPGVYYKDGDSSGGSEMRTILLNPKWFGPTGVVKCGGFTFDQYQTGDMDEDSAVSLDEFQRALDAADILVTTYAGNPPQAVVDLILEWDQKPYHVLFVTADAGGTVDNVNNGALTNVLLRRSLKSSSFFDNGLSWYNVSQLGTFGSPGTSNNPDLNTALGTDYLMKLYNDSGAKLQTGEPINVAPDSFVMADQTYENLAFMAGPFGLPDQGMASGSSSYRIWDGIAEFAVPSTGSPVIPLLVLKADLFGYSSYMPVRAKTDAMMVGADIAHTTVYLGESRYLTEFLATAPPDEFTPGLPDSPYYNSLSVLMSNVWAWAVGNVLAQIEEE